jgi:hypothetical protein
MTSLLTGLVSGLVGAGLSVVLVIGGVTTYNNASTSSDQSVDPSAVPYGDE